MAKFEVGDCLIFRQLDISDNGIRYSAVPVIVKGVRTGGTLKIRMRNSWIREPHPALQLSMNITSKSVNALHSLTHPGGVTVYCYTLPSTDVSGLKKQMSAHLHEILTKQIDIIRRKIDIAASWGSMVKIPSPETADMTPIVDEEYMHG